MASVSKTGWVTKEITRNGQKIKASCKHTPDAEDGKDFHCILSPKGTEVKLDEENSGLPGRPVPNLEPEAGLAGGRASLSPSQADGPGRHPVTSQPPALDPAPERKGGGARNESAESPITLSQGPPESQPTSEPPTTLSQGPPESQPTSEPPTTLPQGPPEGQPNPEPPATLSQNSPETLQKTLNKPKLSGDLAASQKEIMEEEAATVQPNLCATFDEACQHAIGQISKLVFKKRGTQKKVCDVLDEKCNRVKKRTLFPLTKADIQRGGEILKDPCTNGSSCSSWGFFRTVIAPFLASLKAEEFQLGTFKDDKDSLWSAEGSRLYQLAMSQAEDHQELGLTFLSRLIYKSQLDSLTQLRHSRLELNQQLDKMLYLSVGLSLPSILLSILYLSIHLRWAIKNQNEKRAAKKTDRDHRLLSEYQRSEGQPR